MKEVKLTQPRKSAISSPCPSPRIQGRPWQTQIRAGAHGVVSVHPDTCPASPITGRWHVRELQYLTLIFQPCQLVGGGSDINGAYPIQFLRKYVWQLGIISLYHKALSHIINSLP